MMTPTLLHEVVREMCHTVVEFCVSAALLAEIDLSSVAKKESLAKQATALAE